MRQAQLGKDYFSKGARRCSRSTTATRFKPGLVVEPVADRRFEQRAIGAKR